MDHANFLRMLAPEERAGVRSIELLALFCLAKEPISLELAADVLKADKEEVRRAFEVIRTVLVGDEEGRFTIFHSAFRDYFLNLSEYTENRLHRHKDTIDKVQNLLIAYCSRWQEHKSEYALRHYAEHLSEVPDKLPKLFELACNDEFAKTQEQVLPNEPYLPFLTIQLALDAAIKTEKPETMAEMVLRHALRFETTETPLQAQRRGESERAIGLAKQWLERDYKQGTLWLLLLAWSWKKEGKRELAKRCLDEILQRWQGKSLEKLEGWQGEMASFLLGELVEVEGRKDVSSQVLREDKDLRDLAVQSAQSEKFDEALQVACEIEGARERPEALIEIAVVMAKEGMTERAKETFEEAMKTKMTKEIEDAKWHSKALTEIAIAMAKAGKFEEAMKIAEEIEDARERSRALRWIAEMIVKEGMMERVERAKKAMKVAKEIEDAEERSWVMSEIATEMTKVGKFEEAMEVARKIENVRLRLWTLREIAAEMVKAGKIEEAMKVAGEIEDAGERSKVLSKIAGEMARAGEFEEAMKVVKEIEDTQWRSDALGEIAVAIARTGNFEKTMRVVNEIEVAWVRSATLGGIAIEMAGTGMFEEAMKLVKEIEDVRLRSWALSEIAVEMAEVKKFEVAIKMTKEIEDVCERLWALSEILAMMVKVGMFEEAIKVAKEIENAAQRSLVLSGIAEAMAKEGRRERAQDALEHAFQAAKETANLDRLWSVAVTAAQSGFTQKAVEFARQIAGKREDGLPKVMDALVERGAKEEVKKLLDLCGWAVSTAVHACACLIRLYPDHAVAIAEQVRMLV